MEYGRDLSDRMCRSSVSEPVRRLGLARVQRQPRDLGFHQLDALRWYPRCFHGGAVGNFQRVHGLNLKYQYAQHGDAHMHLYSQIFLFGYSKQFWYAL